MASKKSYFTFFYRINISKNTFDTTRGHITFFNFFKANVLSTDERVSGTTSIVPNNELRKICGLDVITIETPAHTIGKYFNSQRVLT